MDSKLAVREHIKRKCKLYFDDPDTVSGHIENERAVTNDYRGRVLYELIQNAVDRAETHIWITLDKEKRSLVVANDGKPFSAVVRQGEPRSDLAALCSLHTSNKKPGESIGNKGVGFKSVWEFCKSVQVRTRDVSGESWGVRLRWPFHAKALESWDDQYSAADISSALGESSIEEKHQGKAPSFYFPEYILTPVWQEDGAVTAVELEDIPEEDFERLISGPLAELLESTLVFVGDIRTDQALLQLTIRDGDNVIGSRPLYTDENWLRIDIDTDEFADDLEGFRTDLGFELTRKPRLSLGFPLQLSDDESMDGCMHSYLPTEVDTGSPLHIQGDFYLSESRKNIDFSNNQYNRRLLKIAVDALIESLRANRQGIASLPYALKLLKGNGTLSKLLKNRLQGNGQALAEIISNSLDSIEIIKLSNYDEIYSLIGRYTPSKTHFLYKDHHSETLAPYFRSFSNECLDIVPLDFEKKSDLNRDPVVNVACPMPFPEAEGGESRLFCRRNLGVSQGLSNLDVPGVVVTGWQFPSANNLSSNLKELSVWSDFETLPVLRSLFRAQNDTSIDAERVRLLGAAFQIHTPRDYYTETQWRFQSDAAHPSQRLLVPVLTDAGWAEVRHCFIDDRHTDLAAYLDQERVFPIDHSRCEAVLGPTYKSVLKFWGVWDAIPIIPSKRANISPLPLLEYPVGSKALSLFSDSYDIWRNSPSRRTLRSLLDDIREKEWLNVSSGASKPVSPASVYIGVPNGYVDGFYLINPDTLGEREWHFLSNIGVTTIESTKNVEKLVLTVEAIASACSHKRQIKGALLSAYRLLIKRINRVLVDSDDEPELSLLNRLPIFYESGEAGERGIASTSEQAWYVSGNQRSTRTKLGGHEVLWWLASGDIGTLASHLDRISTLTTESRLEGLAQVCSNQEVRDLLEREFLPSLMALACYGDIPGLTDVDEAAVQRRWQSLEVVSARGTELHESVGSVGNPVKESVTHISEAALLWLPARADQKKKLSLYVEPGFSIDQVSVKRRLCAWFAEEVFRRRGLSRHFEQLVLGNVSLQEFGVTTAAIDDTQEVIKDWFPDVSLDRLLSALTGAVGVSITKKNWRDTAVYHNAGVRFDQLLRVVPADIHHYLTPLSPIEGNGTYLLSFVNSYPENIATLEGYCDYDDEQWLALLLSSEQSYDFGFDAELFVLELIGLERSGFLLLGERLDLELQGIESEDSNIDLPEQPPLVAGGTKSSAARGGRGSSWSGYLAPAKSDEDYAEQQLSNAKAGKITEKYRAIKAAKRLATLPVEEQQKMLTHVKAEYTRLSKYNTRNSVELLDSTLLDASLPYTELQWLNIIHIGAAVDGAGYDYLDFDGGNDQILLVEAKSSKREDALIHLSEPERCHVVEYSSDEFSTENPSSCWRMILKTTECYIDVTEAVREVVLDHHTKYSSISSRIKAKDWVIEGIFSA